MQDLWVQSPVLQSGKREGKGSEGDYSVYTIEGSHVLLIFDFRQFKGKNLSKIQCFLKAICKELRSTLSGRLHVRP